MKSFFNFAILGISFVIYSCDPNNKPIFNTEQVKLKASISNPSEVLSLQDTLRISFRVPDTIFGTSGIYPVKSLQECSFPMHISLVDTSNRRSILQRPPTYWVTQGSISNNNLFSTTTQSKPYIVTINFKPTEKGLYYLEVTQPWKLRINSDYEALLYMNFDVADKHYNILSQIAPYFSGQAFYDAVVGKDAEGFGMYFFKVN